MIEKKEKGWEKLVPELVVDYLKKHKLWGFGKSK